MGAALVISVVATYNGHSAMEVTLCGDGNLSGFTAVGFTGTHTDGADIFIVNGAGGQNALKGSRFYVTDDPVAFHSFFGFTPAVLFSDARFLFDGTFNLRAVLATYDVYGVNGVDGTNTAYDFSLGWAGRKTGSLPTTSFVINQWNVHKGATAGSPLTNAVASLPVQFGVYSCDATTSPPTAPPTTTLTAPPTTTPTSPPTAPPTSQPTTPPTSQPTNPPTSQPTSPPTAPPTSQPTSPPTAPPTSQPTSPPTAPPTFSQPTSPPTAPPTSQPTTLPTSQPTTLPTSFPTALPTSLPTLLPTRPPTPPPTRLPTRSPTSVPLPVTPKPTPSPPPTFKPTNAPRLKKPVAPDVTTGGSPSSPIPAVPPTPTSPKPHNPRRNRPHGRA